MRFDITVKKEYNMATHAARSGARSGDAGSLTSGLAALAQPFKLRLCRAPHEAALRDYSSNVVLIEPLATLSAVEDFLWPRVLRPAAASAAAASAAAAAAERAEDAAAAAGAAGVSDCAEAADRSGAAAAEGRDSGAAQDQQVWAGPGWAGWSCLPV